MTAPVQRQTLEATLADLHKRIRSLEAVKPTFSTKMELLNGGAGNTMPADGSQVFLPWAHLGGSSLLDLANPDIPVVKAAGNYEIAVWAADLAVSDYGAGSFLAKLTLDVAGAAIQMTGTAPLDTLVVGGGGTFLQPSVNLSSPYLFAAGDEIQVTGAQGSGVDHTGSIQFAVVVKLG